MKINVYVAQYAYFFFCLVQPALSYNYAEPLALEILGCHIHYKGEKSN